MAQPRYPIYIVSKGRWETRHTSRELHRMGVPHYIVVEEQEHEAYAAAVDSSATLLVLEQDYQQRYDPCDDLGDTKSKGPGPARNFSWDHSIASGHSWHWVMDDNIRHFYRLNRNEEVHVTDGTIFRCMEEFCERYLNVSMAGPDYEMFAPRKVKNPPYITNTRIYSCNLIRNDLPYRWRARYNEDTDLSLRMLKNGWVTVQFYAFLQAKIWTQSVRGGNTDEFYSQEGTLPKSQMQVNLHPDVSRLVWKFRRWHHHVDYSGFKQRLVRRPDVTLEPGIDEHGMVYQEEHEGQWVTVER